MRRDTTKRIIKESETGGNNPDPIHAAENDDGASGARPAPLGATTTPEGTGAGGDGDSVHHANDALQVHPGQAPERPAIVLVEELQLREHSESRPLPLPEQRLLVQPSGTILEVKTPKGEARLFTGVLDGYAACAGISALTALVAVIAFRNFPPFAAAMMGGALAAMLGALYMGRRRGSR